MPYTSSDEFLEAVHHGRVDDIIRMVKVLNYEFVKDDYWFPVSGTPKYIFNNLGRTINPAVDVRERRCLWLRLLAADIPELIEYETTNNKNDILFDLVFTRPDEPFVAEHLALIEDLFKVPNILGPQVRMAQDRLSGISLFKTDVLSKFSAVFPEAAIAVLSAHRVLYEAACTVKLPILELELVKDAMGQRYHAQTKPAIFLA